MLPFLLLGTAIGAAVGALITHSVDEKDRQAAKSQKQVADELRSKYKDLQERYQELENKSKNQSKEYLYKTAEQRVKIDGLNLVVELQQHLISLMFFIDKNPSFKAIEEFRKAILVTNAVLVKFNKKEISLPNDYILRNLERAWESGNCREIAYYFYTRGQLLQEQGEYRKALAFYNEAISITNQNHLFFLEKGKCLTALGRYREAITTFNSAIGIEPNDAEIWGERALTYCLLGNTEEELKNYQHALCANPNYAELCYVKGILYEESGDKAKSIERYNQALKIAPNFAEAYYRRGVLNLKLGDPLWDLDYVIYRQQGRKDLEKAKVLFTQQGKIMPDIPSGSQQPDVSITYEEG